MLKPLVLQNTAKVAKAAEEGQGSGRGAEQGRAKQEGGGGKKEGGQEERKLGGSG